MQRMQHQPDRLVQRVVGAVPEVQSGTVEQGDPQADEIAQRLQRGGIRHRHP